MPEFGTYNPYAHRFVAKPLSDLEAFLYLMKSSFGTGCLAMPHAFNNTGWFMGVVFTFLVSFITLYSVHILLSDMYRLCKLHETPQLTYPEAIRLAITDGPPFLSRFSFLFGFMVEALLVLHHFGVCCVYVIFIANNLKALSDIFYQPMDNRIFMSILIVPLILIYVIRSLKYKKFFMIIADCLMLLAYIILLYYETDDLPDLSERAAFQNWHTIPFIFGTVLFSIESVGAMVAIEQEMLNPQNFLGYFGVLNRGMFIVISFYVLFGFLGYWKYGDEINASVTDNLPTDNFFTYLVIFLFSVAIYLEYALQGYVTVGFHWQSYMKQIFPKKTDLVSAEFMVRISVVLTSVLCAILLPLFAHVLSLVGAFCLSLLGIIFPSIMDMCIYYKVGLKSEIVFRNLCLIIIGCLCGTVGTYSVIYNISQEL